MPTQIELLQEAYSRGILPDAKKPYYEEAVRRGLIGGSDPNVGDDGGSLPGPSDWQSKANEEIDSRGLQPDNPSDAGTMLAIRDAYRTQYGNAQDQAQPTSGQEMIAGQQAAQQTDDNDHGQFASALIEALHPAGQVMAGLEDTLAPAVGLVSPDAAQNMRQGAQQLQDIRGNTGSVGGTVGGLAGNIPMFLNPLLAGGVAAGETYHGIEEQKDAGANISGGAEALDVVGQGVLNAAMSKLFAGNVTGGASNAIRQQLAEYVPDMVAKLGARAAVGALINAGQGLASNTLTKETVDPNQSITQGLLKNALLGAGMETGIGALHDLRGGQSAGANDGGVDQGTVDGPAASVERPAVEPSAAAGDKAGNSQAAFADATFESPNGTDPATEARLNAPAADEAAPVSDRPKGDISFADPVQARDIAAARAGAIEKPMYVYPSDGKYAVDSRQPPFDAIRINPDGTHEMAKAPDDTPPAVERRGKSPEAAVSANAEATPAVKTYSSRDMVNYIKIKSEDADLEGARQLLGDKQYVLKDVPVDSLTTRGSTEFKQGSIDKYAKMPGDKAPPVVADSGGQIIDGNRRLAAAQQRGDATIKAYVPMEEAAKVEAKPAPAPVPIAKPEPEAPVKGAAEPPDLTTLGGPAKFTDKITDWWKGGNYLRRAQATAEFDTGAAVSSLKPYVDAAEKLSPANRVAWVDSMDQGKGSTVPELRPLELINKRLNAQNIERAKALGINTDTFRESYVGFMAKKPNGMSAEVFQSRREGAESYMKERKSPSFSDYVSAIKARGLELAYDNPVKMMMAKHAEISKSLSWREEIGEMQKNGDAKTLRKGQDIPDGFSPLPGKLATDLVINSGTGKLVIRDGIAAAIRNSDENSGSSSGGWSKLLSAGRSVRYLVDTYYAGRSLKGAIGQGIGELTGGNLGGANLIRNYFRGRTAIRDLSGMLHDPATRPAGEALERAMKEGGFISGALDKPPPMNPESGVVGKAEAVARGVSGVIQKHLVQPLKIGAILQQAEYAKSRDWSPARTREYLEEATRTLDNMFGGKRGPRTLPPGIQSAMDLLTPTIDYHMAGGRMVVEGAKGALKGRLSSSPAVKSAIGELLATAAVSSIAMAVATKVHTGKSILPQSVSDLFFPRTGEKNPDGTDKRMMITSASAPLAETIEQLRKSGLATALKTIIDPAVFSIAQAIENRDFRGNIIGDSKARVLHAVKGFSPILPSNDTGKFAASDTGDYAAQLVGVRHAPKLVSRSTAEQTLSDLTSDHHSPETPDQVTHNDFRSQIAKEIKDKQPGAWQQAREAIRDGKLTPEDMVTVGKQVHETNTLKSRVQKSDLPVSELMKVWDAATPEEKRQIKPIMRAKLGQSETLAPVDKRAYLKQLIQDTQGVSNAS